MPGISSVVTRVSILNTMTNQNVLMGKRITDARRRRGWSKAELGRRAGVAPSYVTRIEQGKFGRPSVDQVKALADALGVALTDLTEPAPSPVSPGIEAELAAMFRPDEAPLVAEILRGWARHDERTRRYLLSTMKPLVLGIPDSDG